MKKPLEEPDLKGNLIVFCVTHWDYNHYSVLVRLVVLKVGPGSIQVEVVI